MSGPTRKTSCIPDWKNLQLGAKSNRGQRSRLQYFTLGVRIRRDAGETKTAVIKPDLSGRHRRLSSLAVSGLREQFLCVDESPDRNEPEGPRSFVLRSLAPCFASPFYQIPYRAKRCQSSFSGPVAKTTRLPH